MVCRQDIDNFDLSDDDSTIDKLIYERNDIRVRVDTMAIIENLPITNVDRPNNLLSCLLIRDNYIVLSLIASSGKVVGRHKSGRNKLTIIEIKNLLNDCDTLSQQVLMIKAVLKDLIFSAENDLANVMNMKKYHLQ